MRAVRIGLSVIALVAASPSYAGWKLIVAGTPQTAGGMTIIPQHDWSRGDRIGKQGFTWTQDGPSLNALEVFTAIPAGSPLYRERSKKRDPMPRFEANLLLPELVDFFERSFRGGVRPAEFAVERTSPTSLGGKPAVRVRYRYVMPNDELERRGEARLAVSKGALYVVNFHAPSLHYFDAGIVEANAMMDGARFD